MIQGELNLEQGRVAEAEASCEREYKLLKEVSDKEDGDSTEWGRHYRLRGRIALAKDDTAAARAALGRAKEIFQTTHSYTEAGRAMYWLAQALLKAGEQDAAEAELHEAEAIFEDSSAARDLRKVTQKLTEIGTEVK